MMATLSDEEKLELLEEEERDTLPDLYETSEAGDTPGTSESRSATSEERSVTPHSEADDIDEIKEEPRPKMVVFDLDYTLWPFWVDRGMNIELPFKQVGENKVCDATGREVKSFPDITPLLQRLKFEGFKIAIASEAFYKDEVAKLVGLFGWNDYIDYQEIYPGSKIFHFVKIKRDSGIEFPDMLFFDDEKEHLDEVAGTCTGITTVWADRGVSEELVEEAFQNFAENRTSNTYFRSKPVTISRRNSTQPFESLRPLLNMRRRNSIEQELMTTSKQNHTILGGKFTLNPNLPGLSPSLAGINPNLPGLSPALAGINPNLPGLSPALAGINPNLPGLSNGVSCGGGPGGRSKTRRRFSIM